MNYTSIVKETGNATGVYNLLTRGDANDFIDAVNNTCGCDPPTVGDDVTV